MTDLSREARQLIETARGADGPPAARLDAIGVDLFRKVGAGAAALSGAKLAAAASPAVAPLKLGASGIVTYFLIGVTAGVGVVGTSAALGGFRSEAPVTNSGSAISAAPQRARAQASAHVLTSALPAGRGDPEPPPPPPERPREAQAVHEPVPSEQGSFSAEVASLREIQAFLAVGDGARALAASDRYLAEHRAGTLRDEHLAVRVLALCLVGDETRARAAARLFVATTATSPLLPRLARSCVADIVGKR